MTLGIKLQLMPKMRGFVVYSALETQSRPYNAPRLIVREELGVYTIHRGLHLKFSIAFLLETIHLECPKP